MMHFLRDRNRPQGERSFVQVRKAERFYMAQLRKIARHVNEYMRGIDPETPGQVEKAVWALKRYSEIIAPWANVIAEKMLHDVNRRDALAWREHSAEMGRLLRTEIDTSATGKAMRDLLKEQVGLITSLPYEAAERVHKLSQEALITGGRAKDIAARILETGHVTRSRANLIARTEVGRAATTLTQARAESVGVTSYIWRTVGDSDVRKDHRILNGKTFQWNNPPIADQRTGIRANPGCIWSCRCYAEPIINESVFDSYRNIKPVSKT